MDEIDVLVICCEGLEPLQALQLICWNMGKAKDGLAHIESYKHHVCHPSMEWWIKRNADAVWAALPKDWDGSVKASRRLW